MTVQSSPGKGTEVTVDIPLTDSLTNPDASVS